MNRFQRALYWPAPDDEEILRISDRRPCDAVTIEIHEGKADLAVIDSFGGKFIRLNVAIGRSSADADYCILA